MINPEALAKAAFLIIAMSAAGVAHVLWLRTEFAHRFGWPVDGGLTFRGRRVFGGNKRVCGFMVLPPVAALAFMLLGTARTLLPAPWGGALWPLGAVEYAGLGLMGGLAFMFAELPNSFIKRQLDIPPGQAPVQPVLRLLVLTVDRFDSVLGVLVVVSLLVPVPVSTWFLVLLGGPVVHAGFSIAMHTLGIKARAL